jgi:hypothetical protein
MTLYFATLFDINYLSRGLALHESIRRWHKDFVLFVLCLDEQVQDYFHRNKLPGVEAIAIKELEDDYPELNNVKNTRNYIDYLFTLSPYLPSLVLKKNNSIPFICSLDCDQYFFGNSEFIFEELRDHSILIMPHRFTKQVAHHIVYGKYNVSFQVFKNDEIGNNCLALWRTQCLDWCFDKLETDRFADQKYLETWHSYFGMNVKEIDNIGVGLAPWNLDQKKIYAREGVVYVDDQKLILYHYQGMRFVSKSLLNSGLAYYKVKPTFSFIRLVLYPIIRALLRYRNRELTDSIGRNIHIQSKSKTFLGLITSYGMYYISKKLLINLNLVFTIKKVKGSLARKLVAN